jgi:hypothetical protein
MLRAYRSLPASLLCLLLVAVIAGCGSSIPGWFTSPPADEDALYGVGTGESQDLQMATTRAQEAARVQISRNAESKVSALFKQFSEQVGGIEDGEFLQMATDVSKTITSMVTTATSVVEQKVENLDGGFRAYALMKMPIGEANAAIVNRIKAQQNLYTRFRASQAYQELEADTEEYETWKQRH